MSKLKVFKFGGASVKDAKSVINVSGILDLYKKSEIIVVVSAMGKITNLMEELVDAYWNNDIEGVNNLFNNYKNFHLKIINELKINSTDFNNEINSLFSTLENKLAQIKSDNFHFEYDQIVCYGELCSTLIIAHYLVGESADAVWVDARKIIRTNNTYREAKVDWVKTQESYDILLSKSSERITVTQGFIGSTNEGMTTTLGREGSDFTAAIFAYISNAEDVTIWKDVPGMLNADPRHFNGTVLLSKISFTEAVELAYFGASVIHPKTIQPLKKKEIPLYIKSFINPKENGTIIQSSTKYDADVPSYIFKNKQILISLTPKDFSFVVEDQLTEIFAILSSQFVRINLMQNSAVSFSFLIDDKYRLNELISAFEESYIIKYNEDLELLTIRHFDDAIIERLTENRTILLSQKTTHTARLILSKS